MRMPMVPPTATAMDIGQHLCHEDLQLHHWHLQCLNLRKCPHWKKRSWTNQTSRLQLLSSVRIRIHSFSTNTGTGTGTVFHIFKKFKKIPVFRDFPQQCGGSGSVESASLFYFRFILKWQCHNICWQFFIVWIQFFPPSGFGSAFGIRTRIEEWNLMRWIHSPGISLNISFNKK